MLAHSAGQRGWFCESENREPEVGNTWALTAAAFSATWSLGLKIQALALLPGGVMPRL